MKQEVKDLLKEYEVIQWLYENKEDFLNSKINFFCNYIAHKVSYNKITYSKWYLFREEIDEILKLDLFKSDESNSLLPLTTINNNKSRYNLLNLIFKS